MKQSLIKIAADNEAILERGFYLSPSSKKVDIKKLAETSIDMTAIYEPDDLHQLLGKFGEHDDETTAIVGPRVEIVEGKTGEVARQVAAEEEAEPLILNFASAKNPGGGYIRGTRAQEEDLCRCSTLYYNLKECDEYYRVNRECGTVLYTDHMIYSRSVPFFRDEHYQLLDDPVKLSVITAPAPNTGEFLRRSPNADPETANEVMRRRIGMMLALAARWRHRVLVLGAWGCGVFKNDPERVAAAFKEWLDSPRFAASFDRVVFGIYTRPDQRHILTAFQQQFADWNEDV